MSDAKKTRRARFYVDLAPYWQDCMSSQAVDFSFSLSATTNPPKDAPLNGWRRFSFDVDLPVFGGSALAEHVGEAVKPEDRHDS